MPVIKSAKKKLRQDKKRTVHNKKVEDLVKGLIKKAKKSPSDKSIREATSAIDKASKDHIIHKNKAARIKSALSKLQSKKTPSTAKSEVTAKKKQKPRKTAKK